MARVCTHCGAEQSDEALFCYACGNKTEEQPVAALHPQQKQNKGRGIVIFLIIVISLLVATLTISGAIIAYNYYRGVSIVDTPGINDLLGGYLGNDTTPVTAPAEDSTDAVETVAESDTEKEISETESPYGTWYEDVRNEVIDTPTLTGIKAFDNKIEDYKSLRYKSEAQWSKIAEDKKLNVSYDMHYYLMYGSDPGFKFGLYDFDSNGTMDLVISAAGDVVDVYSYKEGKIYKIAPDISYGRSSMYILSGGRFLYSGSNSAFDSWYSLYQVNNAGTGVTKVDSYSYYDDDIFGGTDSYGSAEVFSQKYNALYWQKITLNNINWTEF